MLVTNAVCRLAFFKSMLRPVNFYDQPLPEFGKVDDVIIDGRLTPEMKALPIEVFQLNPQLDLLWGHCSTQLSSS
jgi:hypothetical protein